MDEPSVELLVKYRAGDEQAATELFRRYVSRLTVLARARMAPKIARRFDPEDVVSSAYRSFFVRARNGEFSLERSGDLWRLLVGIMLKKLSHQVMRHTADKRAVDREQPLPAGGDSAWEPLLPTSRMPGAEEAVAIADLVETLMSQLEPASRQVLQMRLLDHTLDEIAATTNRSERTVRRILADLKSHLEQLLPDSGKPRTHPFRADEAPRQAREAAVEEREQVHAASHGPIGASPAPPPGTSPAPDGSLPAILSDRDFVLQLHLGTGGTGRVYQALHKGSQRMVAVKMLKKASQRDPAAVARFLEEARTAARLSHPSIVGIQGIGRARGGGYFLVQELVAGQNLAELAASRPIEPAEAVRWIAEAAGAIDYSHRQRVIHCDLKPANLMLDGKGHVRITDFGLAQIAAPESRGFAAIAGTVGYMAPEQLDPAWGPIGPRTDVFGLGAVLFALLAGRPPFSAKSIEGLQQTMLETSPKLSLRSHRPDVGEELDAICRQCLRLDPRERFGTAYWASEEATARRKRRVAAVRASQAMPGFCFYSKRQALKRGECHSGKRWPRTRRVESRS